jgi:DNA-binding MarR family transcriptional regulator
MIGNRPAAYYNLTPTQQRVFDIVHGAHGQPVSLDDIVAATRLSPDVVVKATTVLVERDLIRVYDPGRDESELQLELTGAAR